MFSAVGAKPEVPKSQILQAEDFSSLPGKPALRAQRHRALRIDLAAYILVHAAENFSGFLRHGMPLR